MNVRGGGDEMSFSDLLRKKRYLIFFSWFTAMVCSGCFLFSKKKKNENTIVFSYAVLYMRI